ncbi:MAG: glycosyltransferase family 4 protein [Candidatus Marinimicrobia bacterium]|nr:glycosyltransferase family 4 protein [Candidatus Neomarinimicrobiota bacterium]
MKIAFITFEYPPNIIGGAGIYAYNIVQELSNLGHEIIVFTPKLGDISREIKDRHQKKVQTIGVEISKKLPFKSLQFWLKLPRVIKNFEDKYGKFDIIHFNGLSYWFLNGRLSKSQHIITVHHLVKDAINSTNQNLISRIQNIGSETGLFMPIIEKRAIENVDKIITVSNFTKKRIARTYEIPVDKIDAIYNGTEFNRCIFTKEELEKTRVQFTLPEKPIVLFVGRTNDPRKGLDLLLKAFKKILEKIDVMLLVVGGGNQTKPRKIAESLGISKNVFFTGFVDETTLKKCYALCDVYVCPSRLEGFGLVILEAMACGKAVVASNSGAIPEVVGNAGILVEPGDTDALAGAIIELLRDPRKRRKLEKKAIKRIHEDFTWNGAANKLLESYKNLR